MRRCLMILPSLLLLAACIGGPPPAPLPQQSVRASFPPHGIANVIRIEAVDSLPLRSAELVAPDGTATKAQWLDVSANPQTIGGQRALSDPWRTGVLSANGINPLPSGPVDTAYRSETQLFLTISTAEIALPDPVVYQRDWQQYRIRLGFGAPGGQIDTREIAAPAPPPA